jgi:hypothetical protein
MGASVSYKRWNSIRVHGLGSLRYVRTVLTSTAEAGAPGKKPKATEPKQVIG